MCYTIRRLLQDICEGHGWVSVGEVCNGGTVGKVSGMGVDTEIVGRD